MNNHIKIAIIAVLIALSQSCAYDDSVMGSIEPLPECFTDTCVGCVDDCLD